MSQKKTIIIFFILLAILTGGYFYLKKELVDAVENELKPKQYLPIDCTYSEKNQINSIDYQKCLQIEKEALIKDKSIEQEEIKITKIFIQDDLKIKEAKFSLNDGKIIIDITGYDMSYCRGNNLIGYIINPTSIDLQPYSNNFNILCENPNKKGKILAFFTEKSDKEKMDQNIKDFSQQLNASKK